MADTDMFGVRSGRDADEAALPATFLRFRLANAGTSQSPGFSWLSRWRIERSVRLNFNHRVLMVTARKKRVHVA